MSSPPGAQAIPYQAYKSKRHSRTLSYTTTTAPTNSRPTSIASNSDLLSSNIGPVAGLQAPSPVDITSDSPPHTENESTASALVDSAALSLAVGSINGSGSSEPSSSKVSPPRPTKPTKRASTFRHMPLRTPAVQAVAGSHRSPMSSTSARSPLASSPLRPPETHSRAPSISSTSSLPPRLEEPVRQLVPERIPTSRVASFSSAMSGSGKALPVILPSPPVTPSSLLSAPHLAVLPALPRSTSAFSTRSNTLTGSRVSAPYRPGFQPKGVYRPRTDEFVAARRSVRDDGRIERTKLERRLEKLVSLHFPTGAPEKSSANNPPAPPVIRRASSFFDVDLSKMDAGGLFKGMMLGSTAGKAVDVRTQEQRITPWQEDSTVTKCPLCSASFHPLTNRKHHCRLCGQIICSLPPRRPNRPITCSLLFIVDSKTRRIEEVGEGVDYGVKKKGSVDMGKIDVLPEEDKFLKGVRVCRTCRPVLLRQQYRHEVYDVPTFARLYEVFIKLEAEIEDSLPQFQELMLSLSNEDHQTKEAATARKRLLEAFAQYDALSKRIRLLPVAAGAGSSQDRVQLAILTRANIFLQKNMFPLQSLPTSFKKGKPPSNKSGEPEPQPTIDPDSELAHALQPLLEQEAMLESYVREATSTRKFEDAKTLRANLDEIRAEIERVIVAADGSGMLGNGNNGGNNKKAKVRG